MSIYKLLNTPVEVKEEVVNWDGAKYVVRGMPSANIYGKTIMLGPEDRATKSRHWANFMDGIQIDADFVPKVLLVKEYLIKGEEDGGNPDGTDRFDETDVAKIAANHGPLFVALYNAAARVSGLAVSTEAAKAGEEPSGLQDAARGKSRASARGRGR